MSILSSPEYPVFAEEVTLSATGALGAAAAFELTGVPVQSELTLGLLLKEQAPGSVIPTAPVIAANADLIIDTFTPDVAGEYSFIAYDLVEIVGVPSFEGDPTADNRFKIVAKQEGIIHVGSIMALPVITADGHGGTIEIRVIQNTIRAAEITGTVSEIGRVAALETSVIGRLNDLVGLNIDSASTDLLEALRDVRDRYNGNPSAPMPPNPPDYDGHINSIFKDINPSSGDASGMHLVADTVNVLDSGIPYSLKYAVKLVNELRQKLIGHFEGSIAYGNKVEIDAADGMIPVPQFDSFWHFTADDPGNTGPPVNNGPLPGQIIGTYEFPGSGVVNVGGQTISLMNTEPLPPTSVSHVMAATADLGDIVTDLNGAFNPIGIAASGTTLNQIVLTTTSTGSKAGILTLPSLGTPFLITAGIGIGVTANGFNHSGRPGVDSTCTPIIGPSINLPTAAVLLCELRLRAYSRHIHLSHYGFPQPNLTVVPPTHPWLPPDRRSAPHMAPAKGHGIDPQLNELTVPPSPIDLVIVEYLDSIIRMDPSFAPPAAEGSGLANMAHKYGFVVTGT